MKHSDDSTRTCSVLLWVPYTVRSYNQTKGRHWAVTLRQNRKAAEAVGIAFAEARASQLSALRSLRLHSDWWKSTTLDRQQSTSGTASQASSDSTTQTGASTGSMGACQHGERPES
jgi:hypothetical protein